MSCSSISNDSGCRSVLLASKQRQRASRKSQKGSVGSAPWAARTAASRNVVLKTSCALRRSPSIKKQKRYSCGKFCVRSDTRQSFVFAKFSATLRRYLLSTRDDSFILTSASLASSQGATTTSVTAVLL